MADTPRRLEDIPNPEIEILRLLKFQVDMIPAPPPPWKEKQEPLRKPDPREPFRAAIDQAMYGRGRSLERVLAVILDRLTGDNADCRRTAARLLECIANAITKTSAPVTSSILAALIAIIEALKSEQDYDVCAAEIDAIIQFVPYDGVRVARALMDLAMELGTDPELRQRVIAALRECPPDVVSVMLCNLLSLLNDKEVLIRRETCKTLGSLGEDGVAAIVRLVIVGCGDNDPSVQREAARALTRLCAESRGKKRLERLKDAARRTRVLNLLASIGEEGRTLRSALVKQWRILVAKRGPVARPATPQSSTESSLGKWAIGIESPGKWHVFKMVRSTDKGEEEWRHQSVLKGIAKGRQTGLLEALAKGGGFLSREDALQMESESAASTSYDRKKLLDGIKPELSNLREIILDAVKVPRATDERNPDPIPWERSSKAWKSVIQIGYAIKEDSSKSTGSMKLRFRTFEQLSPDERADQSR